MMSEICQQFQLSFNFIEFLSHFTHYYNVYNYIHENTSQQIISSFNLTTAHDTEILSLSNIILCQVVIVTVVIVTLLNQHWAWGKLSYTIYNEIVFKQVFFFKILLVSHEC